MTQTKTRVELASEHFNASEKLKQTAKDIDRLCDDRARLSKLVEDTKVSMQSVVGPNVQNSLTAVEGGFVLVQFLGPTTPPKVILLDKSGCELR